MLRCSSVRTNKLLSFDIFMVMKRIKIYKNCLIFKTFFREHSSKEWLLRQKTDPYVEKAKINSYRYFNKIV